MATVKVELKPEERDELRVQRRRAAEEERKRTIFDPAKRTLGIDKAAIEAQLEEKRRMKELERQREAGFAKALDEQRKTMALIESEREARRRKELEEINTYRARHQQITQRREYDLNDPSTLRTEASIRASDDDVRLGVSSLQKFDGEDLMEIERAKLQRDQQRVWTEQQLREKAERKRRELEEEQRWKEQEDMLMNQARQIEYEREQARLDELRAIREYNQQLADEKREAERRRRAHETDRSLDEINRQIHSDVLTENPDTTVAAIPNRKIPYHYKGMSAAERQAILDEQEAQRQEALRKRQQQFEDERRWEQVQEAQRREAILRERERERMQKDKLAALSETHRQQAQEKRERDAFINKELYTNRCDDAYYAQFNTTTR